MSKTRGEIYRKVLKIIKEHPILGVGFGTITQKLGADGRGAGLNESNIFLQVWAGSGILGLVAFMGIILDIFSFILFAETFTVCLLEKCLGCPVVKNEFEKTSAVFMVLGIMALMIPNLFNAGLFMGIFWLGVAVIASVGNLNNNFIRTFVHNS